MAQASNTVVVMPRTLANKAKTATPSSGLDKGASLPRDNFLLQAQKVRDLRNSGNITAAIRKLARIDGTMSDAIFSFVQIANSGYTVQAYNGQDHTFSADGTNLARSVVAQMDTLYDYTEGFSNRRSLDSVVETALREVVETGAVAGELVLNKARLPDSINLVPYEQITYKAKGDGRVYPEQKPARGDVIPLDIPTFWIGESHKEANTAYARSMMESALDMAFYFLEFIEDMRRAVRRSGHTRMAVKIISEKVVAMAPQETRDDPVKLKAYLETVKTDVINVVNSLEPEDALVAYDAIEVQPIKADSDKTDYKELLTALSGMFATSLKSHPSILGLRITGSQSLSNTESLVFIKIARAIQKPVEHLLSRALTLAVRLYGGDFYVKFRFNPIDLRPETELEAFKTMHQARVLEQLSLGFVSDEEAAEALGTGARPAGAPPLSGTLFYNGTKSKAQDASPNDDPMGAAMQPDTPSKGGGKSQ